ncbi:hypothetical protein BKI52_43735 [marine bacterium AO1-C]|nr:hypothetical protein BKI52_43735 [marine bacterium AO1-C]
MKAPLKQQILLGVSIFLVFTSIGFSFGQKTRWFWQSAPYIAIFLTGLGFVSIRLWFVFELQKQREAILNTLKQEEAQQQKIFELLSVREREVIQLITEGKTNQQIADELFIAISTVKTHINNIYKILEVKNRREAINKVKKELRD